MGDPGAQMIVFENHLEIGNDWNSSLFLLELRKDGNQITPKQLLELGGIYTIHNPSSIGAGEWCWGCHTQT